MPKLLRRLIASGRGTRTQPEASATSNVCVGLRIDSGVVQAAMVLRVAQPRADHQGADTAENVARVLWIDAEPLLDDDGSAQAGADPDRDILRSNPASVKSAVCRLLERREVSSSTPLVWLLSSQHYSIEILDAPEGAQPQDWPQACTWALKAESRTRFEDSALALMALPLGASYRVNRQLMAFETSQATLDAIQAIFLDLRRDLTAIDVPESAQRNWSLLTSRRAAAQAMVRLGRSHLRVIVSWMGQTLWERKIEFPCAALACPSEMRDAALVEQLGAELRRTFDAFERHHTQVALARVALLPFEDAQPLSTQLQRHLRLPVSVLDPTAAVALDAQVDAEEFEQHLLVAGACLAGLRLQRLKPGTPEADDPMADLPPQEVNFIEPQLNSRRRAKVTKASIVRAAAFATLGLPLLAAAGVHFWVQAIKAGLDEQARVVAQSTRSRLSTITRGMHDTTQSMQARLAEASSGLSELEVLERHLRKSGPALLDAPYRMLAGLAEARLDGLWLNSLDVDLKTGELSVKGLTKQPANFGRYLQSPVMRAVFQDQPFDEVRIRADEAGSHHAWSISRGKPAGPGIVPTPVQPPAAMPAQALAASESRQGPMPGFAFIPTPASVATGGPLPAPALVPAWPSQTSAAPAASPAPLSAAPAPMPAAAHTSIELRVVEAEASAGTEVRK